MATSGSVDFTVTRNELICSSLRILGQLDFRAEPSVPEYSMASQALNMMVKAWQNRDIGLWLNDQATLHLDTTSESYSLSSSGAHCAYTSYKTATSADADTGDKTIDVDSDDNITDGDYIGIELEDGSVQWNTVDGTPTGDTVALDDALTDDVDEDATVYNYTTKIYRPLEILEMRIRNSAGNDTPIQLVGRKKYMSISDKDTASTPTIAWYDPQLSAGVLYLWPVSDTIENRIVFTVKVPVEDFDAAANNADFPVEWLEALKYNLALRLAPEYMTKYLRNPTQYKPISQQHLAMIVDIARQSLYDAEIADIEDGSIFFAPNLDGYY